MYTIKRRHHTESSATYDRPIIPNLPATQFLLLVTLNLDAFFSFYRHSRQTTVNVNDHGFRFEIVASSSGQNLNLNSSLNPSLTRSQNYLNLNQNSTTKMYS